MHVTNRKNICKASTVLISIIGYKVIVVIYGILHLPSHISPDLSQNLSYPEFFI